MKKFKLFFYPTYIIIGLVVLYYSIDILLNLDGYKENITFTDLKKVPVYALSLFILMVLLMFMELIVENSHIVSLRSKVKKAEKEVLELKAKLYDQSQSIPTSAFSSFDRAEEEGEGDTDEDDESDEDKTFNLEI